MAVGALIADGVPWDAAMDLTPDEAAVLQHAIRERTAEREKD